MLPLTLTAAQKLVDRLSEASNGVAATLAAFDPLQADLTAASILVSSYPSDILDRNLQLTYPRLVVSTPAANNGQLERFKSFSGAISLSIEVQVSSDQLASLENLLHVYVESTAVVLENNAGDWGDGFFYGGKYEIRFASPKEAGLGFAQSAKFLFDVSASRSRR